MQPAETLTAAAPIRPASAASTLAATLRSPWPWSLLVLLALEFLLFDQVGARRFTGVYPRWNDQVQYLTEAYQAHEFARVHGFLPGVWRALVNPSAQGTLHDVLGLVAFAVAGPSRSAALALNVLAVLAWQAALFVVALRARARPALAFTAALLPALLAGPWRNVPGSAFDFRLDHLALCALGITSALAAGTDGFRARGASVLFGVATGLTLLLRFLTGTYFLVLLLALLVWCARGQDRRRRIQHVLLAALVAAAIAGPLFWLNLASIRDYYWIGHYVGPESVIRDPHLGLGQSARFVLAQLAERHLGLVFGIVAVAVTVAFLLGRRRELPAATAAFREDDVSRKSPTRAAANPARAANPAAPNPALAADHSSRAANVAIVGALFFAAPALVLTLHPQKSEVVVSALAPGVVLLVVASWLAAARRTSAKWQRHAALAVALVATVFFVRANVPPAFTPAQLADIRRVNAVADAIFARARAAERTELRIAVDYITDCLDAQVLALICYERHRVWFGINMTLPTGIAEPAESLVLERLAESDFVFLTSGDTTGLYPYDRKLAQLRPRLRVWCDAHLRSTDQFTLFGRSMVLYQRPEIPFR